MLEIVAMQMHARLVLMIFLSTSFDLRVDWHDEDPVGQLRELWTAYEPQMIDYLNRAVDPAQAPSYGVPGDE